jgi:hypothetical protein
VHKTVYMVKEPFVIQVLLAKPEVYEAMWKLESANLNELKITGKLQASTMGFLFEHSVLFSFVSTTNQWHLVTMFVDNQWSIVNENVSRLTSTLVL